MTPNEEKSPQELVNEFKEQKEQGLENPDQLGNADDLHEIQAADDLDEPDPEAADLLPTGAAKNAGEPPANGETASGGNIA
jgi:hypothetical protein